MAYFLAVLPGIYYFLDIMEDSPKVYVTSLTDYNSGEHKGYWLDLADFSSGQEVMQDIQNHLQAWSAEDGVMREEYTIHDFEGFPRSLYSESMGTEAFDKVYEYITVLGGTDLPEAVVNSVVDHGCPLENVAQAYQGSYGSESDFAYEMFELGVNHPEYYLTVSDTDRRIIASEQSDYIEEEGGDIEAAEAEYQRWYDGLDDPYDFFVHQEGHYSHDDFMSLYNAGKMPFIMLDDEKLFRDLTIDDYYAVRYQGQIYIFNRHEF